MPETEKKLGAPIEEPKKTLNHLILWFDEAGELKVKSKGLDIYTIVGVLRAATLRFDSILTSAAPQPQPQQQPSDKTAAPGA